MHCVLWLFDVFIITKIDDFNRICSKKKRKVSLETTKTSCSARTVRSVGTVPVWCQLLHLLVKVGQLVECTVAEQLRSEQLIPWTLSFLSQSVSVLGLTVTVLSSCLLITVFVDIIDSPDKSVSVPELHRRTVPFLFHSAVSWNRPVFVEVGSDFCNQYCLFRVCMCSFCFNRFWKPSDFFIM